MNHATIRLPEPAIKLIFEALMEYEPKDHVEEDGIDILVLFFQDLEYEE